MAKKRNKPPIEVAFSCGGGTGRENCLLDRSSIRRLCSHDVVVSPDEVFIALAADPRQHSEVYLTWLRAGVNEDDLQKIREHVRQERTLGSPKFQAMAEKALGRSFMLRKPGRPRKEQQMT